MENPGLPVLGLITCGPNSGKYLYAFAPIVYLSCDVISNLEIEDNFSTMAL